MPTWKDLSQSLVSGLGLDRPPVAVGFFAAPPPGVRKFMGQVPSGCSFWAVAQTAPAGKSAFYTVPADHYNCPIGSYTHQIDLPPARASELSDMLGLMTQIGYVKMTEVPQIPRWPVAPVAIAYAQLADATFTPDVAVLSLPPHAAMLLGEASRAAGTSAELPPLPRPTCMAIPAAAAHGTTLSLACIGNRIYTAQPESHIYTMLRARDLEAIVGALATVKAANEKLTAFHQQRKPTLTQIDSPA
jgi:uncharacterized protein (DUF169 family)